MLPSPAAPVEPNIIDLSVALDCISSAIRALSSGRDPTDKMVAEPITWGLSILESMSKFPTAGQISIGNVAGVMQDA